MSNVTVIDDVIRVITVGTQGPEGIQGPEGVQGIPGPIGSTSGTSGGVIAQADAPAIPSEGDQWLNTTNNELSIYTNNIWEITTYKSELADDAGNLLLNAGYF